MHVNNKSQFLLYAYWQPFFFDRLIGSLSFATKCACRFKNQQNVKDLEGVEISNIDNKADWPINRRKMFLPADASIYTSRIVLNSYLSVCTLSCANFLRLGSHLVFITLPSPEE